MPNVKAQTTPCGVARNWSEAVRCFKRVAIDSSCGDTAPLEFAGPDIEFATLLTPNAVLIIVIKH
jgi:hypothetical protein